jgi:hypothetical protein
MDTARMIPIPATCANRPTVGGLVAPFANIRLKDGTVDFRSPHQATYARCWTERLCQVCGGALTRPAVLFGGPNQVASGHFDEPPLCPPCALYASKACPMVAGRQAHYATRARVSEGARGHICPDEACDCGGFVPTDPDSADHGGEPAHAWYAVFIHPMGYNVTGHHVQTRCTDGGCNDLHKRTVINGGQLTAKPYKILLASKPGVGRIWQRATEPINATSCTLTKET